jgi:hypothetical protein
MLLNIPPPPPPRELEEAVLSHGGHLLSLTVLRAAGVRKDGEVRYRRHTTVYAVEKGPGLVRLIKSDGEGYTVTEFNCSCADEEFKGRVRECKHRTGLRVVGLLRGGTLEVDREGRPPP